MDGWEERRERKEGASGESSRGGPGRLDRERDEGRGGWSGSGLVRIASPPARPHKGKESKLSVLFHSPFSPPQTPLPRPPSVAFLCVACWFAGAFALINAPVPQLGV